jgi:hypothetical protein
LGKTQGDIDGTVRQTGLGQKNNPNNQMKRKRKKRKRKRRKKQGWMVVGGHHDCLVKLGTNRV